MYKSFFNIQDLPFAVVPDIKFYCSLPSHEEAVQSILHSLSIGDSLITVTGEIGVGKTLVCKKVLSSLQQTNIICHIPNPSFGTDDLYRSILQQFDHEKSTDTARFELLKSIQNEAIKYKNENKNVILVIDESQLMNAQMLESVRLLTNLEHNSEKLIQVILFGQPELDEQLQRKDLRQFAQRIVFKYKIRTLSYEECTHYLVHRLVSAGHNTGGLFSPKAIKLLHKYSQGVPRIINILAHKAMMFSYSRNTLQIDVSAVKAAVKDSPNVISSIYYTDSKNSSAVTILTCVTIGLLFFFFGLVLTLGI